MMKKMIGLTVVTLMACSAAHAIIIAQDTADDVAYSDGWDMNDNGGFGFQDWDSNGFWASYMTTVGDATTLDPALASLNTSGEALRIVGTSDYAQALRDFDANLNIDETFSVDFAAGGPFNNQGFAIRALGAGVDSPAIVQLALRSDGAWKLANVATSTASEFSDGPDSNTMFHFSATQTTAGGGVFSVTRTGTYSETITGTYNGVVGAFKYYASVGTDLDENAIYVNNMMISAVPEPATLGLLGLAFGGLVMLRRRRK